MGVAIGVFVVVALSSVVRGVNESFARDVAAAGPTSFFVYRRPLSPFQSCDPSDPSSCPERRNPAITNDEALGLARASVDLRRHATRRRRRRVQVQGSLAERGHRVLLGELDRRRRRRHLSGAELHAGGERRRCARRDRERQDVPDAVRHVRPDRQGRHGQRRAVHRDRPLSLHGEPDGHAHLRGRRRFAEGDHSDRDRPAPYEPVGARQQPHRQAARERGRTRRRRRRDGVPALATAGCARATEPTSPSSRRTG